MKENLAAVSVALPTLDDMAGATALTGSFNRREIPADLAKRMDEWTKAFLELVARLVLGDSQVAHVRPDGPR